MKIIVAHPFQQHSFYTAAALKKTGHLSCYITTTYNKKGSITNYITRKLLKGDNLKRATARRTANIDDCDVIQFYELLNLIVLLLQRIKLLSPIHKLATKILIELFNKKVVKEAIKRDADAIVLYDTYALSAFTSIKKNNPKIIKILDMSAPSSEFMREIFKAELNKLNLNTKDIFDKLENNKSIKKNTAEINISDKFLVASEITKKSVLYHGIDESKILKAQYGFTSFKDTKNPDNFSEPPSPLSCIFIGRMTFEKGAYHLIDAILKLEKNKFTFKFLGNTDPYLAQKISSFNNCTILGHIPKENVLEHILSSDVLVFPSLCDGFGFAVTEALSAGLPVICSSNAGASEFINDTVNGFIVKPGSTEDIVNCLERIEKNRGVLKTINSNLLESNTTPSWDDYNNKIRSFINKLQ